MSEIDKKTSKNNNVADHFDNISFVIREQTFIQVWRTLAVSEIVKCALL